MKEPSPASQSQSSSLQSLVQQAAAFLSQGQAQQGLRIAEDGMERFPRIVELCNIAGICAATIGEQAAAERYWRQAIAIDPNAAQAYFNLGLSLSNQHREDQAEQYYRQAAALDPGNAAALANLGNLLAKSRRNEEAEHCYRKLIELDSGNAVIYSNLGVVLANRKQDDDAEHCYRQAIALDPSYAKAFSNLGILLARGAKHAEAEQCYRKAIALDPSSAESYTNLGLLLEELKRDEQAEQCHRRALALDPSRAEIYANLGNLLAKNRRTEEAKRCYRQAITFDPGSALVHSSLGVMLANLRREDEAEQCFRRALVLNPNYALAHLNLGFLLLRQGRFAEGWQHHEARYDPGLPDQSKFPYPIAVSFPQWQGEPLAGKSLLVWPEQGLGDEIQFCRYLPLLKRQGATRITLVCKTPLKTLMSTLEGVDAVIAVDEASNVAAHDYWTYPLSIPLHCRTDLASIPAQLPYLRASPDRAAYWASRLPRDGFRVGLVWKGNPIHNNDGYRSLPGLATLAPLWSVPGVRFISLQKNRDAAQGPNPSADQPLRHLGAEIADFADTATIVAQLDLVISVDTAVAHLAGALAKPCWLLLPAYRTDWRWLQGRRDSPWYPNAMRLFRQTDDEDWTTVIQDLKNALLDETARHVAGAGAIQDNAANERQ